MDQQQIVGTWRLVASEFRRSDGLVSYPYGQDVLGILMYDAAGNMAGQMMRADRPRFAAGDMQQGTPEELRAAFEGCLAYFGRYELDLAAGVVRHFVVGCSFPNLMGSELLRFFSFSDNQLTLTTPPIVLGAHTMTGVLVWERML